MFWCSIFLIRMFSSLAPSLLLIGLTASLPQLPIPANRPGSVLTTNIIRPGVRGEVSSVRLVEEGDSDSLSGANLLNVLNNRIVTTNNRASTLPARTRTRVFTTRWLIILDDGLLSFTLVLDHPLLHPTQPMMMVVMVHPCPTPSATMLLETRLRPTWPGETSWSVVSVMLML